MPGNMIATAAHCIGWTAEGMMAVCSEGDGTFTEEIVTADARRLTVAPVVVEACSDVALLGALDGQAFPEEEEAFEAWCEETTTIRLYTDRLPLDAPPAPNLAWWKKLGSSIWIPAHVRTHNKGWITARVKQVRPDASHFVVEADDFIDGGTSGGPVIADNGRLLGVVSSSGEIRSWDGQRRMQRAPFRMARLDRAAPAWAVARMTVKEER